MGFDLLANIGILSLAAVVLFIVGTRFPNQERTIDTRLAIGLLFGAISVAVVKFPVEVPPGATFDTRAGPAVLAGVFGGWPAALVSSSLGAYARYTVGGPAALGGALSLFIYGAVGCLGHVLTVSRGRLPSIRDLVLLSLAATVAVLPAFFVGQDVDTGLAILSGFWPTFLAGNVAGTLILGMLTTELEKARLAAAERAADLERQDLGAGAAGLGFWEVDPTGRSVSMDGRMAAQFGVGATASTLDLDQWQDTVLEDDAGRFRQDVISRLRQPGDHEAAFRIRRSGQGPRHIRTRFRVVPSTQPGTYRAVGVSLDVSDETRLSADLDLARRALQSATNGVIITEASADQPIVFLNRAFETITGYGASEVLGRNCRFLQGEETDPGATAAIHRAIDAGSATTQLLKNRRRDGSHFWNRLTLSPVRDGSGTLTHFIGIQEDVTATVVANQTIEANRGLLDAILQAAPDAILTIDSSQRITTFNKSAETLFGYTAQEAIGQKVDLLVPDGVRPHHGQLVTGFMDPAEPRTRPIRGAGQLLARTRSGALVPVTITLGRFSVDGQTMVTAIARDISEIEEKNQRLQETSEELSKQLEIANEALSIKARFMATVSHELRTPLNAIIGFTDLMYHEHLGPIGTPDYHGYLHHVLESGEHLLSMIDDLLDLARIDTGDRAFVLTALSPRQVIGTALRANRVLIRARRLEVVTQVERHLPLVRADARALAQCLLHLLSNAIKFTEPGGRLTISAIQPGPDRLSIQVRDTGCGIASADLGRIGQLFEPLAHKPNSPALGAGLGLAITRNLLERMGGQITIESELEVGTCVTLTLPTAPRPRGGAGDEVAMGPYRRSSDASVESI